MRWLKRILFLLLFIVLFSLCVGGGVWWAIKAQPSFYKELAVVETNREKVILDSDKMCEKVRKLRHAAARKTRWEIEFSQDELNHWLAIEISEKKAGLLPRRLKNPRGQIVDGLIQAGVFIDFPEFQGVVSLDIVPRVIRPNVIQIELRRVRCGVLPVPLRLIAGEIEAKAKEYAIPLQIEATSGALLLTTELMDGDLVYEGKNIVIEEIEISGKNIRLLGKSSRLEQRK
ncbi:MAG: hypothetical protein Q4D38_08500 [Planctomycetia bacterium]|nr:hypothetical protein [Planctomycetia bacterium]